MYTIYSLLYTLHSTLFCTKKVSTVYCLLSTLTTLHNLLFTIYFALNFIFTIVCTMYNVQDLYFTVYYTIYSTLYCPLCTIWLSNVNNTWCQVNFCSGTNYIFITLVYYIKTLIFSYYPENFIIQPLFYKGIILKRKVNNPD